MKIGILALQGAVQPHAVKLKTLGITPVEVRTPEHLDGLSGIILPGGESTTMIHLLRLNQLWEPLKNFVRQKPTWGICAGSILLAKKVLNPAQESLEAMEIEVERNAYGRQSESFISNLNSTPHWNGNAPFEGVFIRAPKIRTYTPKVKVLFEYLQEPVMVEENQLLASVFHPELTSSSEVHQYFINKCR